ncbi:MAG: prephenate dehydratase [Candidatus Saccharibacteria bacterium]
MSKKVAIQGYQASFHDVAAHRMLGAGITIVPCDTFVGVFKALLHGEADYGVVAIANSIYGPIQESQHLFPQYDVTVCDQVDVLVEQCLIAVPGAGVQEITRVYSHPVALAQCKAYLAEHLPHAELSSHADTAGAVAEIAIWNNPAYAAIAGSAAADLYGMQVVARNIQAEKENYTTFKLFTRSTKN